MDSRRRNEPGRLRLRRLAGALRKAHEQARSVERAKRSFLANTSHRIRTPLNAIVGLTHLLRREAEDPATIARLDQLGEAASGMLGIFNDVLVLSQAQSGTLVLEEEEFVIDTLLSRSCARVAEAARRKGLELMIHAAHLPRTVRGDLRLLGSALVHLLDNAVKFTTTGVVTLSVAMDEAADGLSTQVRFEVRDTGIGIATARLARLYAIFYTLDAAAQAHGTGSGLGLALTHQVAAAMGGTAGVSSQPGVGSTFWFTARLQTVGAAEPMQVDGPLSGRSVLFVDDLLDAREAFGAMLGLLGMRADTASSGTQALALAETAQQAGTPYEVVMLDRLMPDMDGLATAEALIAQAGSVLPAFILVSGTVDVDFVARARELDITSVLQKPVSMAALHGHLLRALLHHEPDASSAASVTPESIALLRARFGQTRVLLAEDHPINQLVATKVLRLAGIEVDVAATGGEAVALCVRSRYDLILMDVQMPEMDGLQATRRIRELPAYAEVPILAMTANAFAEDRAACLAAGMSDHLSKPVEPAALFAALKRWLARGLVERLDRIDGISTRRGLRFFGDDVQTFREALSWFVSIYADGLPGGHQAAADGAEPAPTLERLRREVHSLAGASAAIGASSLQAHAARVESGLRDSTAAPEQGALDSLQGALLTLAARLQRELARTD